MLPPNIRIAQYYNIVSRCRVAEVTNRYVNENVKEELTRFLRETTV